MKSAQTLLALDPRPGPHPHRFDGAGGWLAPLSCPGASWLRAVSAVSRSLINHFTGWPIGLMVLIGNVPLFLLGWRFLGGRRFGLRTAIAIITYSVAVDVLVYFLPESGLTDDIFLNSLYGAVVAGFGYGLVYRARGTSGGSDILARILNHWRGVSMSASYLMVDLAGDPGSGIGLRLEGSPVCTDHPVCQRTGRRDYPRRSQHRADGTDRHRPNRKSSRTRILEDMERGVTVLPGTGAYTGADRPVLYCVVTRAEVVLLEKHRGRSRPTSFHGDRAGT